LLKSLYPSGHLVYISKKRVVSKHGQIHAKKTLSGLLTVFLCYMVFAFSVRKRMGTIEKLLIFQFM
jgi:hypothetical protein